MTINEKKGVFLKEKAEATKTNKNSENAEVCKRKKLFEFFFLYEEIRIQKLMMEIARQKIMAINSH